MDKHQPGRQRLPAARIREYLFRFQRSLNQQVQSERDNGDWPQLVVSGYVHFPQHQWRGDLDEHLALDSLSEYRLRNRLSTGHLDVTVAQISNRASVLRGWSAWAGREPKNWLDDGGACY